MTNIHPNILAAVKRGLEPLGSAGTVLVDAFKDLLRIEGVIQKAIDADLPITQDHKDSLVRAKKSTVAARRNIQFIGIGLTLEKERNDR